MSTYTCPKCGAEHFGRMGRFCRNCKTVWGGLSIGKTDVGRKKLEEMYEAEVNATKDGKEKDNDQDQAVPFGNHHHHQ